MPSGTLCSGRARGGRLDKVARCIIGCPGLPCTVLRCSRHAGWLALGSSTLLVSVDSAGTTRRHRRASPHHPCLAPLLPSALRAVIEPLTPGFAVVQPRVPLCPTCPQSRPLSLSWEARRHYATRPFVPYLEDLGSETCS